MFIKQLNDCPEFIAGDGARLRELVHPDKAGLKLRYSLAHTIVAPGQITASHRLKDCSEVYYIVEGQGIMHVNGQQAPVSSGCTVYIPPFAWQQIHNTGKTDLKFICIVDPAWRTENEEVL